jgi:hypothetical protein
MDSGEDTAWLPLSDAGRRLGLSRGALTGSSAGSPPARLEDVADVLSARLALAEQRLAETVERLVHPPSVPAHEARRLRMALRRR